MGNPGEYREEKILVITGKGRIRASTENGESGGVPKMWDPSEYQRR